MTETIVPADLAAHAAAVRSKTGLQGGDVGVGPDAAHKRGGGYHCGCQDIIDLGEYPTGDYSTLQPRDRVGGNVACAVDIARDWSRGGRAAWLRYNNKLLQLLQRRDPRLAAVRAINFSPDGVLRKRWDSLHPGAGPNGDGVVDSTDNVDIHTHTEFWRNTAGTPGRAAALALILKIIDWAISGTPIDQPTGDEEMPYANIAVPPRGGVASVSLPGGNANRAATWICATNDTGDLAGVAHAYGLRIFLSNGHGWFPAGGGSGLFKAVNGVTLSVACPDINTDAWKEGVRGVSVMRAPLDPAGNVLDPKVVLRPVAEGAPAPVVEWFDGDLTFCIEQQA